MSPPERDQPPPPPTPTPPPADWPTIILPPTGVSPWGSDSGYDELDYISLLDPPRGPNEMGRIGHYRLLQLVGSGGMGHVFRAEHESQARPLALKLMRPHIAVHATARQRFLREGQACATIKHENVITVYEVGETRGVPFMVAEFLQGTPLDQMLFEGRVLPIEQILRISSQVACGLQAAHEKGLIHRDIKPANLWLEATTGRVVILDFGLARLVVEGEDGGLTQPGSILGTPQYMSPEQARGEAVDHRSDLFSLGSVMYRLCTGQLAWRGKNTLSLLMALENQAPLTVCGVNPSIPPALGNLIDRMLSKDVKRRPATAHEVVRTLQDIERKLSGTATKTTNATRTPPRSTILRNGWGPVWFFIVGLLVATVVGASIFFGLRSRLPSNTRKTSVAHSAEHSTARHTSRGLGIG